MENGTITENESTLYMNQFYPPIAAQVAKVRIKSIREEERRGKRRKEK
jgi:hypothetical protein